MSDDALPTPVLSEAELARLRRKERTLANRRNRRSPSVMPERLARTSAFAPRKKNLSKDSDFTRVYVVRGVSVCEISGRELGAQHRDALYALWRLPRHIVTVRSDDGRTTRICETVTSWRQLLQCTGRTLHTNNLLTLLQTFKEIKQVMFIVHDARNEEDVARVQAALHSSRLPGSGHASSLIESIYWEGANLDSKIVVRFGQHMMDMMAQAHLVSINADVQFKLKSFYAGAIWPWIDSQNTFTWITEERIAELTGRDQVEIDGDAKVRGQFRKEIRQAFEDMVRAAGLTSWTQEVVPGKGKRRVYHYVHANPRACEATAGLCATGASAGTDAGEGAEEEARGDHGSPPPQEGRGGVETVRPQEGTTIGG